MPARYNTTKFKSSISFRNLSSGTQGRSSIEKATADQTTPFQKHVFAIAGRKA